MILILFVWAFRRVGAPSIQVDAMFISGVLTVVGYSVHDTIVVFDRIRENIRLALAGVHDTVDYSINQTLGGLEHVAHRRLYCWLFLWAAL